jgi:hypothetical protein
VIWVVHTRRTVMAKKPMNRKPIGQGITPKYFAEHKTKNQSALGKKIDGGALPIVVFSAKTGKINHKGTVRVQDNSSGNREKRGRNDIVTRGGGLRANPFMGKLK